MKAVFVRQECLLQKAIGGGEEQELRPGVAEGLVSLAATDLLVILLGDRAACRSEAGSAGPDAGMQHCVDLIRQIGGRVDALVECPHRPEDACDCWGTYPGFLHYAAAQLELRLEECYLLCTEPNDALLAYKVGCRPMLCLNGQSIGAFYNGHQPEPRDFPIARDFRAAVDYVLAEEEASQLWGHARPPSSVAQLEEELLPSGETPALSPILKVLSPLSVAKGPVWPTFPLIGQRARQLLALFIFGGVWLSLGIAYILTHLYRVQPFPEFVYYLTLQFIPRPARGLLFIGTGVIVVVVSIRAFWHLVPGNGERRR